MVRRNADRFHIVGLAAGHDSEAFRDQVAEFRPALSVTGSASTPEGTRGHGAQPERGHRRRRHTRPCRPRLLPLPPLKPARPSPLASKEVLVVAGELVMREVARTGAALLPVDSEHSALWQCLTAEPPESISRLILTASGGPFFTRVMTA